MKKVLGGMFALLLTVLLVVPIAQAATISVSQAGADPDTVMKGKPFTITVSGLSGSGTVSLINLPTGFSAEGSPPYPKSFSSGTASVSWTSATISQSHDSTTITAQIAGAGSPETAKSSSFSVIILPSISLSVSPSSVTASSVYSVSLNIQNNGETSAKSVSIAVVGTGMSISSGCPTIASIAAGSSSSVSCAIMASTAGSHSVQFIATPSNADSKTKAISVSVASDGAQNGGYGNGGAPPSAKNASRRPILVPGIGLRNNTKLQAALEKVLNIAKLSEHAIENLIRLSASITANVEVGREFNASNGTSKLKMTMKYKGNKTVKNFTVWDKIPKTFAEHADNITVTALRASYEVVEEDPEYVFVYPELSTGDEVVITYDVGEEVDASIINDTETEVYAMALEEVTAPPTQICTPKDLRCVGNNLEVCSDDGVSWALKETCEYGCDSLTLSCKSAPALIEVPSYIWYIVAAIIVIVIVIVVLVFMFYKKQIKPGFSLSSE